MSYPIPHHRILEIVQAPKRMADGQPLRLESQGQNGRRFDATLDLVDGPYCDLRYTGTAGQIDLPSTYHVNLLLAAQRVRGIGFNEVGRQNFRAKLRIQAGWHQNFCDPNLPTDHPERNRHETLTDFAPTDFPDLIQRAGDLWKIDVGWEKGLV